MYRYVLLFLIVVFGALTIRAEYVGPRPQVYALKPLTTILIFAIALLAPKPHTPAYKYAILAGLVFSLGGDIFLMLPKDRFIAGLVSFLLAQICYIIAFTVGRGFSFHWMYALPCLAYGVIIYTVLLPHLGSMKLPVLAYVVVILVMAWQSAERWGSVGGQGTLLAFLGAVLFVISDTVLALDRFRGSFGSARALVLSTYYAAQWLIASSIS